MKKPQDFLNREFKMKKKGMSKLIQALLWIIFIALFLAGIYSILKTSGAIK